MLLPSKNGIITIGLLFIFYISSMQSQSGLLFLVMGAVIGCYIVNLIASWRSVRGIVLGELPTIRLTEGKKSTLSLEVVNTASKPIGMLKIDCKFGTFLNVSILKGRDHQYVNPEITFPRRGVYQLSDLNLTSTFPFGMVIAFRRVHQEGEFVVYPATYPCPSPKAAGFEPMIGGAYTGKHKSMSGSDFSGIRPYQPQDSVKSIHWKSSSKGQGIMVKEFNEELSGRITFIVDCSPVDAENGERLLDWITRAAGSLIFAALEKDHHIELIDLKNLELVHNPSFCDGDLVLETLARLEEQTGCLNRQALQKAVEMGSKKAALCLVLTTLNDDVVDVINTVLMNQRVVTVCLPVEQRNVELPAGVATWYYDEGR